MIPPKFFVSREGFEKGATPEILVDTGQGQPVVIARTYWWYGRPALRPEIAYKLAEIIAGTLNSLSGTIVEDDLNRTIHELVEGELK